ncbi:MAG TPA: hypothetical protein VGB59_05905 [Allosphingosinicella sp.]|jgi:hypothetical protein
MDSSRDEHRQPAPPPGSGEGIDEASKEAVKELERRRGGEGHAGAGDIG